MLSSGAPTTSGLDDVYVDEDAPNEVIDLYSAFDDAEDEDGELIYEIAEIDESVESGHSSLFDNVYIDGYGGDAYGGLVLEFGDDAYGEAEITIRVWDTDDQTVETTFTVEVESVNDAPVISDFLMVLLIGDLWRISGTVTDVDNDVDGMVIDLGGILEGYDVTGTVQADGTFLFADEFPGLVSGYATGETEDDDGLESNLDWHLVSVV